MTSVHRAEAGSTQHTWMWGREDGSPRDVGLTTGCPLLSNTFLPPNDQAGLQLPSPWQVSELRNPSKEPSSLQGWLSREVMGGGTQSENWQLGERTMLLVS